MCHSGQEAAPIFGDFQMHPTLQSPVHALSRLRREDQRVANVGSHLVVNLMEGGGLENLSLLCMSIGKLLCLSTSFVC